MFLYKYSLTHDHLSNTDDGKDFIEVAIKNNLEVADVASWRIIRSVANSIIQTCVSQPIPQGGMVTDTGAFYSHHLFMNIKHLVHSYNFKSPNWVG